MNRGRARFPLFAAIMLFVASVVSFAEDISPDRMRQIFEAVKTPFKYGVILRGDEGKAVDCPSVFRRGDSWYMVYICMNQIGYETHLARSRDLCHWEKLGTILPFSKTGWDAWQGAGTVALQDPAWGGRYELKPVADKYWMSYLGGARQGYETDPLAIGMAWTTAPDLPETWHRIAENPVLSPDQPDARPFEAATLYRSFILRDETEQTGYPFVMYYNGKQQGPATERIGMAGSRDLIHWRRLGSGPVIDNGRGISGDPQIARMGDMWVMFYYGAFWKPGAFDTFAASNDLVHWTRWDGPPLVEPSEPWDKRYAHKPWVIAHEGVVYHFYCAVGDQGRVIALATSKDLGPAKAVR